MTSISSKSRENSNSIDSDSHESHPDYRLFGLILFLIADGMTFAGFFAAYLTYKAVNPLPENSNYELELLLPTINTFILLLSSYTFHKAGKSLIKDSYGNCSKWLAITALLGLCFLISQMIEYFSLPFGLTDNLFASTFYALTGFHGLHVTLGTIMILIVLFQTNTKIGIVNSQNQFPLEAAELYWHFVDGIWVILFIILYLL